MKIVLNMWYNSNCTIAESDKAVLQSARKELHAYEMVNAIACTIELSMHSGGC